MRVMACLVAATTAIAAGQSVRAQTYDPNYPVCMQTYGPFSGINVATHRWPVVGCWRRVGRHNVWLTHTSCTCKGENGGTDVSAIRLDLLLNAMSSWSLYTSAARSGFNSVNLPLTTPTRCAGIRWVQRGIGP